MRTALLRTGSVTCEGCSWSAKTVTVAGGPTYGSMLSWGSLRCEFHDLGSTKGPPDFLRVDLSRE